MLIDIIVIHNNCKPDRTMDYLETSVMVENQGNLHMCNTRFCQTGQLSCRHHECCRTCHGRSSCCYIDIERSCCCLSWMDSCSGDSYFGDNYSVGSYCIHSCSRNYCWNLLQEGSQDQRIWFLVQPLQGLVSFFFHIHPLLPPKLKNFVLVPSSACLRRLPQGMLYPWLFPPLRAPLRTAPPSSPAPRPRTPPSMSSLPVLKNLVSVFVPELVFLVLGLEPLELLELELDPPNFS